MCLFLWQASIYPVLGQGSKNGAMLSYNIAREDTKKANNVNDNALENTTAGTIKIVARRGESLWGLAQKYHTTVDEIVKRNHLKSPNQIREGESLWVLNGDTEQKTKDLVTADVNDYPREVVKTASEAVNNMESMAWWVTIFRNIPTFATHSSDSRSSEPDLKIPTYEIIVNENTQFIDRSSKSTSSEIVDAQKQIAQKKVPVEPESQVLSRSIERLVSKEDVELLSRVIYGEARGEDFEGQVAVGAVVLNRLKDPRFPKTIRAIIYQSGAFTAVDDQQICLNPDDQACKAAEAALSGVDPTNGAIFYFNPRIATDRWIKSRPVIKRIGNHTFSI